MSADKTDDGFVQFSGSAMIAVAKNCPRCGGVLLSQYDLDVRRRVRHCLVCGCEPDFVPEPIIPPSQRVFRKGPARKCAYCGIAFTADRKRQRFCGASCAQRARVKAEEEKG